MRKCETVSRLGSRVLQAIALQGAEIIGIAKLCANLLKEVPVALLALRANLLLQMALEIAVTRSLSSSVLSTSKRKTRFACSFRDPKKLYRIDWIRAKAPSDTVFFV